jgi:ATP-dependent Clp protease ATP-binding subunit ClpC
MSRTLRYHVLLWRQSSSDGWSGRLLDDLACFGTASADKPAAVLRELKDYLHGVDSTPDMTLMSPDFNEPEVRMVKVQAVPEYEVKVKESRAHGPESSLGRKRTVPCAEPVTLKLPCVVGKRGSGLICALLPTLDVEFELSDHDKIEEMALHYARQELKGLTPARLLRLLPPAEWRLETISITPRQKKETGEGPQLKSLSKIADHAGATALRKMARTWERDAEVGELENRLRHGGGSVLLVGESGCGKSAVLIEAARRVEKLTGESGRKPKRFWITSAARLIAGMRWLGEWQERLEAVIEELRTIEGVLCLESLQELMRLGGSKPESSIAAFLIPYLRSGELRLVVEATPAEVDACERTLPGFLDAFSTQRLHPLSNDQEERVLQMAATSLNGGGKLEFSLEAARDVGRLCKRFQPYAGFPGTPMSLMNEAAARARDEGRRSVRLTDVRHLFAESTGLPDHLMDEAAVMDPAALRDWFSERLVSQSQAVDAVCRTVLKFKTGLNDPRRPLAVLLFTGPTGTGKTQLAKFLGDWLFPHRKEADRLVRLDMSEYAGHDAARRLLGDPFGEPSDLVKRLRQNPFTVLLLDEVEKAAPEVFDTLMNVFDEGRLTDALGRTTWFRSTVIIMTSNLGTRKGGALGFGSSATVSARADTGAITQFFRPEFFNRLDQVVTFDPLGRDAVEAIARREILAMSGREGLTQRGIRLQVSDALLHLVCERGFDPVYGARPLQRRLEELIVTPLAHWIVGHPAQRDIILQLDWNAQEERSIVAPSAA